MMMLPSISITFQEQQMPFHKRPWSFASLPIIVVGALFAVTFAAEPDSDFAAGKQVFLREMKKKSAPARVEAVEALGEFPNPEAAALLLKRGLADPEPSVRLAVRKSLRKIAAEPAVGKHLFDEFKRSIKKHAVPEELTALLGALVTTSDETLQADLIKSLDDYLALPKGNLLVPMTLIDESGQQGEPEAVQVVTVLAKAKAFNALFGYRRSVVQAMSRIREPEAITFLIEMLPTSQGLIQYDIVQYLTRTTKQKFRDNDRDWTNWWKENQKTFKFPPVAAGVVADQVDDKQANYYGIPICAKRVVFVLDTSASMRGLPMEAAKQALIKVVEALPEAVSFDVVMFDLTADAWQPRLVPASYEAKQGASQNVMVRGMKLGTASHAALNTAFGLEPECIYFLSDGEPTDGRPADIIAAITQMNRTRRVSIHTIGVVTQRNGSAGLRLFMQPLAEQNYGTFRLIE
jgi:von Willebrand factor type A domain